MMQHDKTNKKYSVALISSMPANAYSGGRYHAWIMMECLANEGNSVTAYVDNIPVFSNDFNDYYNHDSIRIIRMQNLNDMKHEEGSYDYCICIPTLVYGITYFYSCAIFAMKNRARLIIVNFESPNWFVKYGKKNNIPEMYMGMKRLSEYGSLILSSAYESMKYAQNYYGQNGKKIVYDVWSPAINSKVADSVYTERENVIFIALRIFDKHKGGKDLIELLDEGLRGYTIVCMVGVDANIADYKKTLIESAQKYGISIEFKSKVSDKEKFKEMKRAKVVLFPSYFEGYGYPPVEGLYCGARVIAYDLPVIREICGDNVDYCDMGNTLEMKGLMRKAIEEEPRGQIVVDTGSFYKQAKRLNELLDRYYDNTIYKITEDERRKLIATAYSRLMTCENEEKNADVEKKMISFIKDSLDTGYRISSILDESREKIEYIEQTNKKVYFYGCGKIYRKLYKKYSSLFPVHGIIDEYKKGMTDEMSGRKINGIEILFKENSSDVIILITPLYSVDEIILNIRKIGDFECHSICMMELNGI